MGQNRVFHFLRIGNIVPLVYDRVMCPLIVAAMRSAGPFPP